MKKTLLIIAAMAVTLSGMAAPKAYTVSSPDGKLCATISAGTVTTCSLSYDGQKLTEASTLNMVLSDGTVLGEGKIGKVKKRSVNETITPMHYRKSLIEDNFNEISLPYKTGKLVARAYNDGFAWRFVANARKEAYNVLSESADLVFCKDFGALVPYTTPKGTYEKQFNNSFENRYASITLSGWQNGEIAFLPLMVEAENGVKMVITESDLRDYPGMYLTNKDAGKTLSAVYAGVPDEVAQGGHNKLQMLVKSRKPYIAECSGEAREFPWRIVCVSSSDIQLADNDMVYRLASPKAEGMDFSWVKPGKVAWDWWNDWNIRGVDFKAGVNDATYKHYIDFASANGIEYVILDEGWAVNLKADLFQVIPEINLQELTDYAASKNVGLILWAGYWAFHRDMEKVCQEYSKMGIKGFKVDFMNRDDQYMERFLEEAAAMCAKYHMVLDFHGIHKPTGLQRMYPNVLNYEGVFGLEQMKWSKPEVDMVSFDVQIPFIRFVAGFADYTQGAMLNATKKNYHPVNSEPMSQGTRCHQMGEYMIFDAPLTMLCDSPSNYMDNMECTSFIAAVPTTWDETKVLCGEVGKYIVMARRKAGTWYIGGIGGWDERNLCVDLSPLGVSTNVEIDLFRDGVNAHRSATDYRHETVRASEGKLNVHLAPGGGFAAKISQ